MRVTHEMVSPKLSDITFSVYVSYCDTQSNCSNIHYKYNNIYFYTVIHSTIIYLWSSWDDRLFCLELQIINHNLNPKALHSAGYHISTYTTKPHIKPYTIKQYIVHADGDLVHTLKPL